MSEPEHQHEVAWIKFDGRTEWEVCSCGLARESGTDEWHYPRWRGNV